MWKLKRKTKGKEKKVHKYFLPLFSTVFWLIFFFSLLPYALKLTELKKIKKNLIGDVEMDSINDGTAITHRAVKKIVATL